MTNSKDALLKTLLGSECVRYFPQLAEYVGGAQAALMLSQLLYWRARTDDNKPVLKSVGDMQHETGLSPAEQVTARDKLDALGVCPSELKGMPRVWHYYPSIDTLAELIGSGVVWRDNPLNTDKRKSNRVLVTGEQNPIARLNQAMAENPIERLNHSMEKSGNVARLNQPILTEKIGQLNKVLETTEETTEDINKDKEEQTPENPYLAAKVKKSIISELELNGFGSVGSILSEAIDSLLPRFPDFARWQWAVSQSVRHGVRTWAYLEKVLENGPEGVPASKPQRQQSSKPRGQFSKKQPAVIDLFATPGYTPNA